MWLSPLLSLVLATATAQKTTTISVVDGNSAPLSNVLVIISQLEGPREVGRYLTDEAGKTPPVHLGEGLHRIIATCPSGPCETTVREVFGSAMGSDYRLQVRGIGQTKSAIQVVDASGAPFPGVLVIIKTDENGHEVGRYLSGVDGRTPPVVLARRRYWIALTCPHGICETKTHDVYGPETPADLRLDAPVMPTSRHGVLVGAPRIWLAVERESEDQSPVDVLVRDPDVVRENWYRLPADGRVEVTLPHDPCVVLLVRGRCISAYQVGSSCPRPGSRTLTGHECFVANAEGTRLKMPVCK